MSVHGKRWRPFLTAATVESLDGNVPESTLSEIAVAVECFHKASLVHDDIEDDSPTRRGRDTVWKIWGVPQAINAGDAMFAISHIAMNRLIDRDVPADIVVKALRRFDETCVRLTQGQMLTWILKHATR